MEIDCTASEKAIELFGQETIQDYVRQSLDLIAKGCPKLDGRKKVGAMHHYKTEHGKVSTFATWVKGKNMSMAIGMEEEMKEMQADFLEAFKELGVEMAKTPKDRAEERKKKKK